MNRAYRGHPVTVRFLPFSGSSSLTVIATRCGSHLVQSKAFFKMGAERGSTTEDKLRSGEMGRGPTAKAQSPGRRGLDRQDSSHSGFSLAGTHISTAPVELKSNFKFLMKVKSLNVKLNL